MFNDSINELMNVAERKSPADLVFRNINVLNMFTESIEKCDISIVSGKIARVSISDSSLDIPSKETIDGNGKYMLPGFIDAHTHIEMSFLSPTSYADVILPQGTTSAIVDMHDVCNVGINCMQEHAKEIASTPLKARLMIPPCVPGTPKLEDAGTEMTLASLKEALGLPNTLGLGEAMDFGRIFDREPEMMSILSWAKSQNLIVDGHCPNISGDALQAYTVTGISSDHESSSLDELHEKHRLGMKIILRRGSLGEPFSAGDFVNTLADNSNVLLSTDGCVFIGDLLDKGGMIDAVRQIISEGVEPLIAVKLATYNVARAYGIDHEVGVIAPGRAADLIIVDDLDSVQIQNVYLNGELVPDTGDSVLPRYDYPQEVLQTIKMSQSTLEMFKIAAPVDQGETQVRVINLLDGTVLTTEESHSMNVSKGLLEADESRDLLKIAVFDRHRVGGKHSLGIVKGFGFKNCSFAGSVGQDSQNIVVIGCHDEDMCIAVNEIRKMQGGLVVVSHGEVKAAVHLPISGIMSPIEPHILRGKVDELTNCLNSFGGTTKNPAFNLSLLLSCAVIPFLKITNQGLVDAESGEFRTLFINPSDY